VVRRWRTKPWVVSGPLEVAGRAPAGWFFPQCMSRLVFPQGWRLVFLEMRGG
jgi:hypothetical protein